MGGKGRTASSILKLYAVEMKLSAKRVGIFGLLPVIILVISLLVFGFSNEKFSFFNDFISKLGAKGEPNAFWFNIIHFMTVGTLMFIFGMTYGVLMNDKVLSILLSLFGLGFAFTAIPIDLQLPNTPLSKAHVVAICLGLAFWMFGLSRLGYNQAIGRVVKNRANFFALALLISMIGFVLGIWSMPITHRLVFGIVFGWTALTSIQLIRKSGEKHITDTKNS